MTTASRSNNRIWTVRRVVAAVCLLVVLGALITPIQWYLAYVGVQRAKRRHRNQQSSARTPVSTRTGDRATAVG
jgi:hypothetical protein